MKFEIPLEYSQIGLLARLIFSSQTS